MLREIISDHRGTYKLWPASCIRTEFDHSPSLKTFHKLCPDSVSGSRMEAPFTRAPKWMVIVKPCCGRPLCGFSSRFLLHARAMWSCRGRVGRDRQEDNHVFGTQEPHQRSLRYLFCGGKDRYQSDIGTSG